MASSFPGLYIGTLTSADLFLLAQQIVDWGLVSRDQGLVGVDPLVGDGCDLWRVLEKAGNVVLQFQINIFF